MGLFGKKKEDVEEGLIDAYTVIYLGGHPDYPKKKTGGIELKLFQDHFEFSPTFATKSWFGGLTIPYHKIIGLEIVQRQVSTLEGVLGGLASRQLNQANNLHIKYETDGGHEVLIRLEMLTGVTVMGQARKCQEFEDRLKIHSIREMFRPVSRESPKEQQRQDDIPAQIEKLAALREKGILSEEEFDAKKADLLARM